jgi:hypothetical protein
MFTLFAQQVARVGPRSEGIGELIGGLAVLLLFGTGMLEVWHGQRRREWEHAERMRALELGVPVPPRETPWARAVVSILIGVVVPLIAFGFTCLLFSLRPDAPFEVWIAPAVVSVVSVIGACILAGTLLHGASRSGQGSGGDGAVARRAAPDLKPETDPDAFDVVGRRG